MKRAGIVLAAGAGTRMQSAIPKVMHRVAGLCILGHVIRAMRGAGVDRIVVVTAPSGGDVRTFAESAGAEAVVVDRLLGTGYSAAFARDALSDFSGDVVVTYGDQPLLTPANFRDSFAAREHAGMSLIAFVARNPGTNGRVILDEVGLLDRIVEHADASDTERRIKLCNAGIMVAHAPSFFRWASMLENRNARAEYYLTDVPAIAKRENVRCAVARASEMDVMGVNSPAELAKAEAAMQSRLRQRALNMGGGLSARATIGQ